MPVCLSSKLESSAGEGSRTPVDDELPGQVPLT